MMMLNRSSPANSESAAEAPTASAPAVLSLSKSEPRDSDNDENIDVGAAAAAPFIGELADQTAVPSTTENPQSMHAAVSATDSVGGCSGVRRKDVKVCRVCGDKALGFNFDAISCESCKAFFRRNALKQDVPACMFTQNCSVTVATRRFCTHCRLQKCIQVGMRPELVNADEVRGKKLRREAPPQLQQQQQQQHPQQQQPQQQPLQLPQQQPSLHIPATEEPLTSPMPTPAAAAPGPAAAAAVQQQMVLNPALHAAGGCRSLTHEQWLAVSDLHQAYELSFSDTSEDATPAGCRNLNTLVNSSCFIVKKLILFAKKLPDFIGLGQACQIALLKGAVIGTLFLRSAVHYDRERDVWVTPKGDVPTAILKDIPGFAELHDDHLKFCRLFKDLLRDPFLVPLVQVLALFTPDRPNVTDRSAVADVQDRYICLLKHYLEGRCGFTEARRLLPRILSAMEELHDLAGGHGRLLLHVNPAEVDPLLLEVFDIAKAATAASGSAPSSTSTATAAAPPMVGGVPMCVYQRRPAV
ncbi:hypothetical protein BOX15_Mlig019421g30 [Macrostomum lignano]|uniref:Nuclear receptor domain-containing protein n=1 Tax=Macrostomum lignano TaxID=282301 RepID=A0A267F5U0_9PLAT|nr:hypothetical protein BOX15_Mlig019421g16 [Macrostomum lignano]PAA53759.1 hypothetical protein BOX15_Mlig027636g2 [Macrostomum lignano]PAA69145.1 hypothetical protein BOX15_Mlig019421g4 [Macrostomum lignano]PAA91022.1 hypothetical protein BOX15_Mlig019421g30 [Macrostomum lignano]